MDFILFFPFRTLGDFLFFWVGISILQISFFLFVCWLCLFPFSGLPWTEDERRSFLIGLKKMGKGDWNGISKKHVPTRTPTQVASRAQKYFIRMTATEKKRRLSLFDIPFEEPVLHLFFDLILLPRINALLFIIWLHFYVFNRLHSLKLPLLHPLIKLQKSQNR